MNNLKILQANVGRGREATEAVKRMAVERAASVICVTEPYHNLKVWSEVGTCYAAEDAKACVVLVEGVGSASVLQECNNRNAVYVK